MLRPHGRRLLRLVAEDTIPRRSRSELSGLPFTEVQRRQVLEKLNTVSEQELRKFAGPITLRRLMEHREQKGAFGSFRDLLSAEGVDKAHVLRCCTKMLMLSDKDAASTTAFMPNLKIERLLDINNVTSLQADPPFLTFVTMDPDHNIVEWQRSRNEEWGKRKTSLEGCYKQVASIHSVVPQADIFIMEQISERPNPALQYKHTVQAILYTMLSLNAPDQPRVVHVKPNAVANYFDLKMGADRVSCQDVFKQSIRDGVIKVSASILEFYESQNGAGREYLGLNALQCLLFYKMRSQLAQWSVATGS